MSNVKRRQVTSESINDNEKESAYDEVSSYIKLCSVPSVLIDKIDITLEKDEFDAEEGFIYIDEIKYFIQIEQDDQCAVIYVRNIEPDLGSAVKALSAMLELSECDFIYLRNDLDPPSFALKAIHSDAIEHTILKYHEMFDAEAIITGINDNYFDLSIFQSLYPDVELCEKLILVDTNGNVIAETELAKNLDYGEREYEHNQKGESLNHAPCADRKYIKSTISRLFKLSKRNSVTHEIDYDEETILNLNNLLEIKDVWAIDVRSIPVNLISRVGSMYGGYPYTSKRYPWPKNSNDIPLQPFVQINLDEVKNVSGIHFGAGLLQVWLDTTDINLPDVIRLIKRSDYINVVPSDVYHGNLRVTDNHDGWAGGWDNISMEICFSSSGKMCCDWESSDLFSVQREDGNDEVTPEEQNLINSLETYAESNGPSSMDGGWLLGHPDGITVSRYTDYYADNGNCFIAVGSGPQFPPSDVGFKAYIHYRKVGRKVDFWFDWSRG